MKTRRESNVCHLSQASIYPTKKPYVLASSCPANHTVNPEANNHTRETKQDGTMQLPFHATNFNGAAETNFKFSYSST